MPMSSNAGKLKKATITLILTFSVLASFGQNFQKDIENGLYIRSSGLVCQLSFDTLKVFKLSDSKSHYYEFGKIVFDTLTIAENHEFWDRKKPSERFSYLTNTIQIDKSRFSIVYPTETGFNSINYDRKELGYEMSFSEHNVSRENLKKSIVEDTAQYLTFYAFTSTDLKNIKSLKKFKNITTSEFEDVLTTIGKYESLVRNHMNMKSNSFLKSNGITEMREVLIKGLIELGFNPLIEDTEINTKIEAYKLEKQKATNKR